MGTSRFGIVKLYLIASMIFLIYVAINVIFSFICVFTGSENNSSNCLELSLLALKLFPIWAIVSFTIFIILVLKKKNIRD